MTQDSQNSDAGCDWAPVLSFASLFSVFNESVSSVVASVCLYSPFWGQTGKQVAVC